MKKKGINYGVEILLTAVIWFVLRMGFELIIDSGSSWKDIALWAILCGIFWVPIRRFLVKKNIIKDEFE